MKSSASTCISILAIAATTSSKFSAMAFQPIPSHTTRMSLVQQSQAFSMLPSFLSNEPSPVANKWNAFVMDSTMSTSSLWLADTSAIIDMLRTIAVGITALVFFLAGLALLMVYIIGPAAAKGFEKECKELSPELWMEYQAKLEPGETIATRPDLVQELGTKIQPLLEAKIAQLLFEEGDTDEDWNTRPQVDLSALTDQEGAPSKPIDVEKKE